MYITESDMPAIAERVNKRLIEEGTKHQMRIVITGNGGEFEDNWLYIPVTPLTTGIRPSEYANILGLIIKELRQDQIENVLLVPTIPD
ncbi:MAG: hypothetical protein NTX50_02975 [Candidatus Sumerlaeota bacterium]|nr:hypothetical protein [Candidatus Sumerlaeota bacterium]